jgi:signal transduction histidine kinase
MGSWDSATRAAGRAAALTSVGIAGAAVLVQSDSLGAPWMDAVALTLLGALGAAIAVWTDPRWNAGSGARSDPRRVKEEFLNTVSHELRTPLNAILGWTELLRTPRALPRQQVDRGLEVIERNARRQLALVEDLLAVAEPAADRTDWTRVDIDETLRRVVDGFRSTASLAQVALVDEAAVEATPAPAWVYGHAPSLGLALRHVIDNAIKFTPPGGQVLTRLRQAGDQVLIFVTDTGAGIEPSQLAEVFEPFAQQDGSTSRGHGGLGLGLTIARRLVERHGGHLDLRSEGGGGGATVLVTLPTESA